MLKTQVGSIQLGSTVGSNMVDRFAVPAAEVRRIVETALTEDLGWGDLTTDSLVPLELRGVGEFEARSGGVLAGLPVAFAVFRTLEPEVEVEILAEEGTRLQPGQIVGRVRGSVRTILRGERVALNLLQRLSGIATATAQYVDAVAGLPTRIIDTRKTTPGLRVLEKYAVRMGGGQNHRFNLSDGVLIKDNHLIAVAGRKLTLAEAVTQARRQLSHMVKIEVEVDRIDQVPAALEAGADAILLDNMSPDELREAIALIGGRAPTEASGGVTLTTVRAIAESGVDFISVGALTHSVRALDISLELQTEDGR